MRKLKEKELLKWLKKWIQECSYNHDCHDCPPKKANPCAKAFLQIKEMIQKEVERDEIEVSYIDIVIDLYDQLEQKKPKVTEEWIEEKAKKLASMITDYMPYGQKSGEPFELNEIKDFIHSLVEEIRGVEIVEK